MFARVFAAAGFLAVQTKYAAAAAAEKSDPFVYTELVNGVQRRRVKEDELRNYLAAAQRSVRQLQEKMKQDKSPEASKNMSELKEKVMLDCQVSVQPCAQANTVLENHLWSGRPARAPGVSGQVWVCQMDGASAE
jgi:hypothetical protein